MHRPLYKEIQESTKNDDMYVSKSEDKDGTEAQTHMA